jgi:hypothetical protein
MSRLKVIGVFVGIILFFILSGLFLLGFFKPKSSGLLVETNIPATVLMNGEIIGTTPYEGVFRLKNAIIKLVPVSRDSLEPYETKVTFVAGIQTVIRRDFGRTVLESAGEVISFEKIPEKTASLSVISNPDALMVSLDGVKKGFTPLKIDNLNSGNHQLTISGEGFVERTISLKTTSGYRLTVETKLAEIEFKSEEIVKPQEEKETVTILDTPVGFLRVRELPSTQSVQVGEVIPGDSFSLLEKIEDWYKIKLEDSEGWVSAEYASVSASL